MNISPEFGKKAGEYKQALKEWLEPDNLEKLRPRLEYQTAALAAFALAASLLLGLTDAVTSGFIQLRLQEDLKSKLEEVIPAELYDNDLLQDQVTLNSAQDRLGADQTVVYLAKSNGRVVAACFKLRALNGYSGAIDLVLGVDRNGEILGTRVISHAETPGLGDKIEIGKSRWILSFNGKSLDNPSSEQWAVKKDGGVFDQFSGATITPRAVVQATRRGLEFYRKHRDELADKSLLANVAVESN